MAAVQGRAHRVPGEVLSAADRVIPRARSTRAAPVTTAAATASPRRTGSSPTGRSPSRTTAPDTFPWGYNGGRHGASSEKLVLHADGAEERLPSKVETFPVKRDDRLIFSTAGAGGLGDPLDREPERTAADVHAGLVSVEAAASEYGVIVSPDGVIDHAGDRARAREDARPSAPTRPSSTSARCPRWRSCASRSPSSGASSTPAWPAARDRRRADHGPRRGAHAGREDPPGPRRGRRPRPRATS